MTGTEPLNEEAVPHTARGVEEEDKMVWIKKFHSLTTFQPNGAQWNVITIG